MFGDLPTSLMVLRRLAALLVDLLAASTAFLAAYAIVHGYPQFTYVPGIYQKTGAFTAICGACILFFGVDRASWRYASIPDLVALIKASVAAVIIYLLAAFLVSRGDNVPRSVPILTLLFLVGFLCAIRLAYRIVIDGGWDMGLIPGISRSGKDRRNVVLVGLSHGAESYIRAAKRISKDIFVAGIIDETELNRSRLIQGVKIIGGLDQLPKFCERSRLHGSQIDELIVTEHMPSRKRLSDIVEVATTVGVRVTRIPEVTSTSSITSNFLLEPKPIELGDLLGRPEVTADVSGVSHLIEGRVVLATGAGGSIGSELCRQIAMLKPQQLIITDSSEHNIYMLDKELRADHPDLPIVTRIMNVRDLFRVNSIFEEFRPHVVFHAAALKHVPLVEYNICEGVKTNVLGTRNVANAALHNGAATFVMISTDKAVNPTNVMGATKRAAEAYCQTLDLENQRTSFKTVRFGNVLGSNGSVVPRFQEQIAAGGPVTVTHPHIVRFFMTIPEAVRLVLNATAHGQRDHVQRGKIMVLDMGKPVRIVDLAERMIQLAGYKPRTDIEIVFTGLRPGEKLYEELFDPSEVQDGRTGDGYVVASPRIIDKDVLNLTLAALERAIEAEDDVEALTLLSKIVPEYKSADDMDVEAEFVEES
ncbi:nucleoside-diphosphate sugar epimerase/dehydratase [Mesorhizobium sp. 1M-11]|uniref:polysaccharide biosynthesis protein n=1 Tax=Mesorhizobium sp. 1M-11 TaxID=1529006 RepID=UPI000A547718|nr:nucleoside-diphosphate sugar epimerase/dehydratase [Mesorhizobium sp. 1M-11]